MINLANAVTICRLLLIPVIFQLILRGSSMALLIFGVAALTDLLDGQLARRANQVTEFGRILDPLVDRLLISGIVIALYISRSVPPVWALAILLVRDLVIMAGAAFLRLRGHEIRVTILGKSATAVLLIAITVLTAGASWGIWIFYTGLVLYISSGFDYLARGKNYLLSN